jgi:UDP-2,3-diacylglucosamine pyrophosphatase LpxH
MDSEACCPRFDRLYVISDLHIGGGKEDMQIFTSSKLLAAFIRSLIPPAAQTAGGGPPDRLPPPSAQDRVALVMNGDVVDFLAEDPPTYLDIEGAVRKLRGVVERRGTNHGDSFCDVFAAMRDFLEAPNRHLVLVLGNHDLELALPHAQDWLSQWLTQGEDAARGRLTFATDGSGYRCDVGSSSVLCVHGEVADRWNAVDHHSLRAISHVLKAGKTPPAWHPNAGTKLVRDVMNDIKREYPFVDLLKPEIEALLPILKTLNAATFARLTGAVSALEELVATTKDRREQFLTMDKRVQSPKAEELLPIAALQLLHMDGVPEMSAAEQAEVDAKAGLNPMDLARQETTANQLLLWQDACRRLAAAPGSFYQRHIQGKTEAQMLLECLRTMLKKDETFNIYSEDEPFAWTKNNVSDSINFVVAGHTHLERCIFRPHGAYFNSGTWANLIKLDPDLFKKAPNEEARKKQEADFTKIFLDLQQRKTIKDLQYAKVASPVPTVVVIATESPSGPARGALYQAKLSPDDFHLQHTPNTTFSAR